MFIKNLFLNFSIQNLLRSKAHLYNSNSGLWRIFKVKKSYAKHNVAQFVLCVLHAEEKNRELNETAVVPVSSALF